jgi:hypothetical protein
MVLRVGRAAAVLSQQQVVVQEQLIRVIAVGVWEQRLDMDMGEVEQVQPEGIMLVTRGVLTVA